MTYDFNWLQFFADGAAGSDGGGEGAATGAETGAADRTLEDLGVPHEKAERFYKKRGNKAATAPAEAPTEVTETAPPAEPTGMSWDDFMKIPENQQRLQTMMADRGKKATETANAAKATMAKLGPMLDLVAGKYGIQAGEDGQYDLDAITQAVTNDDSYYTQRAEELGVDVDVARQLEQANRERRQAEAREQALLKQQQKLERDEMLRQHFMGMQQQANELRRLYPDFDLERELQNPDFLRYTSPEVGMSVDQAFYALHHDAILQQSAEVVARKAKADAAASIRSGVRPRENGSAATAAVSSTPDLKHMTREDRRAYIRAKYTPPG